MRNKKYRKLSRVLLAAAAAAALLAVTALATDWFGLAQYLVEDSERTVTTKTQEGEETTQRQLLSLAGWQGSPEYQASAQWEAWRQEYVESDHPAFQDDWPQGRDEEFTALTQIYPCYDDTMADKLVSVAEEHGLALHTLQGVGYEMASFYKLAGTEPILLDACNQGYGGYVYPDGSFKLEGNAALDGANCAYTFLCAKEGSLPPFDVYVRAGEDVYQEWTYTTGAGDTVCLDYAPEWQEVIILYAENGSFTVVLGSAPSREAAEALADTFDFHAACMGEPQVEQVVSQPAHRAEDPGQAATLADFTASAEYRASHELGLGLAQLRTGGPSYQNFYYAYPSGRTEEDALLKRIGEKYGLELHETLRWLASPSWAIAGDRDREPISFQGMCALTGCGEFLTDPGAFTSCVYFDNGGFVIDGLLYIPKGTLCTTLEWGLENAYGETWFYQTESGAVVEIGTDTVQGAPSYILYESPNAWVLYLYGNQDLEPYRLEGIADRYDFGQFA